MEEENTREGVVRKEGKGREKGWGGREKVRERVVQTCVSCEPHTVMEYRKVYDCDTFHEES